MIPSDQIDGKLVYGETKVKPNASDRIESKQEIAPIRSFQGRPDDKTMTSANNVTEGKSIKRGGREKLLFKICWFQRSTEKCLQIRQKQNQEEIVDDKKDKKRTYGNLEGIYQGNHHWLQVMIDRIHIRIKHNKRHENRLQLKANMDFLENMKKKSSLNGSHPSCRDSPVSCH